MSRILVGILVGAIRGYQILVSPALPRSCKYYPSCSQYAIDAIRAHGVFRGLVLACWRLLRCNPLSYGGYDPVERQKVFGRGSHAAAEQAQDCPGEPDGWIQRVVKRRCGAGAVGRAGRRLASCEDKGAIPCGAMHRPVGPQITTNTTISGF